MGKKINDNTITKRTSPDGNDQLPLGAPGDSTDYVLLLSKLKEYVMEDVAEALDGEDLTVNSIAKTGFVSGTGGNGWKLYANGNGEVQDLYVRGNETVKGYVSSENFVSGAAGAGWKLNNDGTAEFESLYIRGAFSATEFRVRKITSQGGNLAITDAARISNVIEESDHYHCLIDTENGTIAVQLEVDDLVRCQIWDGPTAKYYTGIVVDKGAGWFDIEKPLLDGAGVPAAGDTVFRWGNVSTANRQGLIYLSSNDSSAPYMDVYDGIDGVSYSGKLKARLGKLSGITSPAHGALTGYGLYANRAYLENAYISGAITVGAGSNVYTQAETDNKVNNKSKNYTTTPTNYQTGDTWTLQSDTVVNGVQYKAGDLLTASAASASYNQAHWTKQVRYTDDTAFNTMQFPTTNLLDDGEYMKFDPYSTGTGTSLFIYWGAGWSNNFHEATPDSGKTLKIISPVTAILVDNAFGIASAYINFRSYDPTLSCSIMFEDYPSSRRTYYANGHGWVQIQTNPQKTDYYHPYPKIILEMNQTGAKLQYNRLQFVYGTINPSWSPSVNDVRNEINNAAGDLEDYVNGAFEDGVIEQAEAKAIEKYINVVNETYEQLTQQYSVVYADTLLTGTPKTNLATAKSNLDSAKSALISSITTAISDGKTTAAEKSDVDSKYSTFKTRIGEYTTAVENAYKSITDAINTTANSKAKLFTTNPPSGYNAGDLWIPQSDYVDTGTTFKKDNLYRATTTSASFSKSHWVIATSYTDDTVANSKTTTFTGATAPTPNKINDLWFDTTNKKWKTWNGSTWDVREDKVVGYIKDALDESTEVVGGLTLGTVMAVKKSGVVKAYMSAVGDYAFAAGVTNFADVGETRAFAVKHNGDIEIKYGGSDRLKFVASTGVLTINGTVNSTSGSIGGFTIESNKLKSATPAWETEALVLNKTANTFEFYSGYQTDDGTQYGNIIPDIKIQAVQGFKDILNNPVGEIYCGGFYALPTRYSTVVGGNGISSNCSNISFKPDKSESGKESNASIAARIKVDADKIGDSIYSFNDRRISAAIAGVTDLTQGSKDSRTYGGYFNSLFTGTFHTGVKYIDSSSTFYFAGEFFMTIYCISGASGAWLMFPEINHEEGRVIYIRNSSGGTVNISRSSSESLSLGDNSTVTSTSIANKETQVWQRLNNQWRQILKQTF